MRFYIPKEAVAINKIYLNYKVKGFRSYSTITSAESSHTHGIPSLTVASHTHPIPALTVNSHTHPIPALTINSYSDNDTIISLKNAGNLSYADTAIFSNWFGPNWYDAAGNFYFGERLDISQSPALHNITGVVCAYNSSGSTKNDVNFRFYDAHGHYFFTATQDIPANSYKIFSIVNGNVSFNLTDPIVVQKEHNYTPDSTLDDIYFNVSFEGNPYHRHGISGATTAANTASGNTSTTSANTASGNSSTTSSNTTAAGSSHTHGVTIGIVEEPIPSPLSIDISAGIEGSETVVGTYTDTDEVDIDITDIVEVIGAGNWINVKFEPNDALRLEVNAFIQIYIESN
jgi:hypothetical protein